MKEIFKENYKESGNKFSLESIFSKQPEYIVLKDFFSQEMRTFFLELNRVFNDKYQPSDGYTSLPRPFGGYLGEKRVVGYQREIDYIYAKSNFEIIEKVKAQFASLLDYSVVFSDSNHNYSHSKSFFALRELESKKGSFDIHCGNYFNDWNKEFFDYQGQFLEPRNHLSFLSVLQQHKFDPAINIFHVNWNDYQDRVDLEHLISNKGDKVNVASLAKTAVKLNPGDLLIFNESHFWHQVPQFEGNVNRITLGGFISKFSGKDQHYFWA